MLPHLDTPPARTLSQSSVQENPRAQDIPLNFGSVISRNHAVVQQAEAYPEEPCWLTDEVSLWGADIYLAVDREIPGARIKKLSSTFLTKVFEGPYRGVVA